MHVLTLMMDWGLERGNGGEEGCGGGGAPNKQTWEDVEEHPLLSGFYKALSSSWH